VIPDVAYRFAIRPLAEDEGGYLIEFPDLPGRMSDAASIEDAITNGLDAMRGWHAHGADSADLADILPRETPGWASVNVRSLPPVAYREQTSPLE
jgi:predicted RNase H-like HicB family nuclease